MGNSYWKNKVSGWKAQLIQKNTPKLNQCDVHRGLSQSVENKLYTVKDGTM